MVGRFRDDPLDKTDSGGQMRRGEMYRYIGYVPKRQTCTEKVRYSHLKDAKKAAYEYNRRVVFADMNEYWCRQHECWHIGHRDKRRLAMAEMLKYIFWFESLNRGN